MIYSFTTVNNWVKLNYGGSSQVIQQDNLGVLSFTYPEIVLSLKTLQGQPMIINTTVDTIIINTVNYLPGNGKAAYDALVSLFSLFSLNGNTQVDSLFAASPAYTITGDDIGHWNSAYGWGSHAGLYKSASYVPAWNEVTGKPTLSLVATTGRFSDLVEKPEINNLVNMQRTITINGVTQDLSLNRSWTIVPTETETDPVWEAEKSNYLTLSNAAATYQPVGDYFITGSMTTDNLTEGTTKVFFTNTRWDTRMSSKTTDNLVEGSTNLYYTDARAKAALSQVLNLVIYNNTTPAEGDFWFDGTDLRFQTGGITYTINKTPPPAPTNTEFPYTFPFNLS